MFNNRTAPRALTINEINAQVANLLYPTNELGYFTAVQQNQYNLESNAININQEAPKSEEKNAAYYQSLAASDSYDDQANLINVGAAKERYNVRTYSQILKAPEGSSVYANPTQIVANEINSIRKNFVAPLIFNGNTDNYGVFSYPETDCRFTSDAMFKGQGSGGAGALSVSDVSSYLTAFTKVQNQIEANTGTLEGVSYLYSGAKSRELFMQDDGSNGKLFETMAKVTGSNLSYLSKNIVDKDLIIAYVKSNSFLKYIAAPKVTRNWNTTSDTGIDNNNWRIGFGNSAFHCDGGYLVIAELTI